MKLLALDTSTEKASVALLNHQEIIQREQLGQGKHAQLLLPLIEQLLAEAEINLNQLDGIAFGRGPGSFTGLRIACSIVKGLSYPFDLPLFPVSSLAAIAYEARTQMPDKPILALLDARMNELYWAYYPSSTLEAEEKVTAASDIHVMTDNSLVLAGLGFQPYQHNFPNTLSDKVVKTLEIYPQARAILKLVQETKVPPTNLEEALPVYVRNQVTYTNL